MNKELGFRIFPAAERRPCLGVVEVTGIVFFPDITLSNTTKIQQQNLHSILNSCQFTSDTIGVFFLGVSSVDKKNYIQYCLPFL